MESGRSTSGWTAHHAHVDGDDGTAMRSVGQFGRTDGESTHWYRETGHRSRR